MNFCHLSNSWVRSRKFLPAYQIESFDKWQSEVFCNALLGENTAAVLQPHIFASLKKRGEEKRPGYKKEAGIPGLSTGRNSQWLDGALGGRRGLARPAIEPPLPMPRAINRHNGCLSDESSSSSFPPPVHLILVMDLRQAMEIEKYEQASQPARGHSPPTSRMAWGNPQPQASSRSQPPPSLCTVEPVRLSLNFIPDFPEIGVLVLKYQIKTFFFVWGK